MQSPDRQNFRTLLPYLCSFAVIVRLLTLNPTAPTVSAHFPLPSYGATASDHLTALPARGRGRLDRLFVMIFYIAISDQP